MLLEISARRRARLSGGAWLHGCSRVLLLGALAATEAAAAEDASDTAPSARESFERGYRLAQRGDLDGAIAALQLAYRSSPHFSVLYNLAQAYAASGRVVEAIDTFERYLSLGGSAIGPDRVQQVRDAIAYHAERVATLELSVQPAGASVTVDGVGVDVASLGAGLRLGSGKHVVVVSAEGYLLGTASVELEGKQRQRVEVALERAPPAHFERRCDLPDVAVRVDDALVSSVFTHPHPISAGKHVLTFSRAGYLPQRITWLAKSGEELQVPCTLRQDPAFSRLARLEVRRPPGTELRIDGQRGDGARLPEGRHSIAVSGDDYETKRVVVDLRAGESRVVVLQPSRTARWLSAQLEQHSRTRRGVAYVAGGVALLAISGAVALYVSGTADRRAWERKSADLTGRLQGSPETVTTGELDQLIEEENGIRDRDSVALALGVGGALTAAVSVALFLWPDIPSQPSFVTSGRRVDLKLRF